MLSTGSCAHLKNGLSPGDYLVLQSPILQSAVLSEDAALKQATKSSPTKQACSPPTKLASPLKTSEEVNKPLAFV